ncbi:MAG: zinc ribbon domain-containing protein [Chloroflexi bacterium]|nr:zinc ribbon domain-containing protein [Chloroflexota bacterium]
MPTYVYACDTCQVQFEKFQSFHDEPLRSCPSCQSSVRRVLQPAGIVFKGSGWHITDYKSGGESSSTASSTSASESSAGNSEGGAATVDTTSAASTASTSSTPAPTPTSPASSTDA